MSELQRRDESSRQLEHRSGLKAYYRKFGEQVLSREISLEEFVQGRVNEHLALEKRADHDGLCENFLKSVVFSERLMEEIDRAVRLGLPISLFALDIDRLADANTYLGHIRTDRLIQACAKAMEEGIRPYDLRGRVGGDEFCLALTGVDITEAKEISNRIREGVIKQVKEEIPDLPWDQTISIGITQAEKEDSAASLRQKADQALYEAKKNRNSIFIYGQPPTSTHK